MRRVHHFVMAAALLLPSWIPAIAAEPVPLPMALSGCWESVDGDRRVIETWFYPAPNRMIGISETRKAGTSVAWEFLRIEREGDSLVFRAIPSGQSPAEFPLLSHDNGEYVFENLQHDFPQRVVYPLPSGDELRARIEGPGKSGEVKVVRFTYRRMDCGQLWPDGVTLTPAD